MPTNWGSRGFGTTSGTATTDVIVSGSNITKPTVRSYHIWGFANTFPGTNNMLFNNISGATTNYEQVYSNAATTFQFQRQFATTDGVWRITHGLSTSTWFSSGIAFDSSTNPIWYINGASVSVSTIQVPSGALSTGGTPARVGNDNTATLPWNGRIAQYAMWDSVLLTAAEFKALSQGALPWTIRPASLTLWWPLDGLQSPEPDLSGGKNNGTVTGALAQAGPPIMQLTPRWPQFLTPPVAGSVKFRKTLSQIGGRVGTRQASVGWFN